MPQLKARLLPALLAVLSAAAPALHAQANASVTRGIDLSAFAGLNATYIGFDDGRTLGFTAGVDIGPDRQYLGLRFAAEGRGTIDIDDGSVAGERSLLGGVRVEKPLRWIGGRFTPSVDLLAGRGEFLYVPPGYVNYLFTLLYHQYAGNVLSPGAGFTFDLTPSFAFHADAQFQRWNSVPVTNTHPLSIPTTVAVTYRFGRRQSAIRRIHR